MQPYCRAATIDKVDFATKNPHMDSQYFLSSAALVFYWRATVSSTESAHGTNSQRSFFQLLTESRDMTFACGLQLRPLVVQMSLYMYMSQVRWWLYVIYRAM